MVENCAEFSESNSKYSGTQSSAASSISGRVLPQSSAPEKATASVAPAPVFHTDLSPQDQVKTGAIVKQEKTQDIVESGFLQGRPLTPVDEESVLNSDNNTRKKSHKNQAPLSSSALYSSQASRYG